MMDRSVDWEAFSSTNADKERARLAMMHMCACARHGRDLWPSSERVAFYDGGAYGPLTDEEGWAAFKEAERQAISAKLGYPVSLDVEGDIQHGGGIWLVRRVAP